MVFISIHIFVIFDQYFSIYCSLQLLNPPSCLDYLRPNPYENVAYNQDMSFEISKLFVIF